MIQQFDNLIQMMAAIPDEQTAIEHFTAIRWKTGAFCPYCGTTRIYHFSDLRTHKCGEKTCRKRFSIKVGTIFEDSKIPMRQWLLAIYLITSHKKGIASTQLARDIGVTQKTAWFMLHRLRHATETDSFNRQLSGEVEVDETLVGGKTEGKGRSYRGNKTIVMGMREKQGDVLTRVIPDVRRTTIWPEICQNVAPGSTLHTDELHSYRGIALRGYRHMTVNHRAGQYVSPYGCTTNGIESIWALLKRQIIGTHHWLSPKHLPRYLTEMTWRFNRRELGEGQRVNALLAQSAGRLTYKELIA